MKTASSKRFLALLIACLMVVTTCLTVTINAAEWDYDDEGTGMPDPDDPSEGLPFDVIDKYYFTYEPSVYGYGNDGVADMSTAITSAKAGDVIWFKLAVTDIEKDLLLETYDGFYDFEGYYTYDVEAIERYYGGKTVGSGRNVKSEIAWLNQFMHLEQSEGMVDINDINVTINWANVYSPSNPPAEWLPDVVNGYGQHFSVMYVGMEYGAGITEDEQFYICVPLKITEDAAEGKEFTFTVPYPNIEEFADAYYWDDTTGYVVTDSVYGRGGSYTIIIDNHDDVEDNLAHYASYAVATAGNPLEEYITEGFLNDLEYPLTENSNYTVLNTSINGSAVAYFKLASLSDLDDVVLTFNDTADADLPSKVEIYGIDADEQSVLLGTVENGVAYYDGVVDSTNYDSSVTVNAANAYQYTLSGIDTGKYQGVYLKITGAASDDGNGGTVYSNTALGEVEIKGEAAKVSVSIVDGTITNESSDGLYLPGTELTIVADDVEHKEFAQWITDNGYGEFVDDSASTTTFVVGNADEVISATYEDVLYELNIVNGTISSTSASAGSYIYGDTVGITADAPEEGKVFDKWVISVEGTAAIDDPENPNAIITVYGDATVTATYKDCYTLIVNNGEGTGSYPPGTDADIVADDAEDGFVFHKWEVVNGDVVIDDVYSASTKATVNSDAEVQAVYVEIYKNVPENLVTEDTVIDVVTGTVTDGSVDYVNDQLYPIISDANWLTVTDDTNVVLSFDLGAVYDISSTAFNFSLPNGYVMTDTIVVYGANNSDLSDKTELGTLSNVNNLTSEKITFDDSDISITTNSNRYAFNVDGTAGYRYIVVEFSTDYKLVVPTIGTYYNNVIKIGEVEIYGEISRYDVSVEGGTIVESSEEPTDKGYVAGTVLTIVPNEDTDEAAFEKWIATVGTVENNNGTYTYTVSGDAVITAAFTEINQPVPENLAPGATVTLLSGTLVSGDESYVNDQLYPMTAGAKWNTYSPENKQLSFMLDLGDYYDVTSGRFTFRVNDAASSTLLPWALTVQGANSADGSDAVNIAIISDALNSGYTALEFADFEVITELDSVAVKYDVNAATASSYRYIIVTASAVYNSVINQYYPNAKIQLGEIEIYGEESSFEVTIENGTITDSAVDDLYDDGTVINIAADEIPHKQFAGWIVDGEGEFANDDSATTTFTVGNSDAVITAVYTDILYNLVVDNGSGDGEYIYGTTVSITADAPADPEKVFDKWVSDSDSIVITEVTNSQTTVTVNGNGTVEAVYKDRVYLLTVESGTGSGNYTNGSTVQVVADAPAADMSFDRWEIVTGSCVFADASSSSTTVTTTNEPTTIRPIYVDNLYGISVDSGSVSDDDYSEDGYKVGTTVTIIADEIPHKEFSHWEIDGNGTFADDESAETEFTTGSGDMSITAVYTDVMYTLTVENGTGTGSYVYGTVVEVDATTPESLYVFDGWSIVAGFDNIVINDATAESVKVTVNGDATISADWTLVYKAEIINGAISEDTVKDYYYTNDTFEIVADAPEADKVFSGWVVVNGECTISDAHATTATVTVGSSDLIIRAEYTDVLYKVTIENGVADQGGSEVEATAGSTITIVADNAPEGYEFDKWVIVSGEGTIVDPGSGKTDFVVGSGDVVVQATYKESEKTVGTGDSGLATFALLAVVALAGTVVVSKKRNK